MIFVSHSVQIFQFKEGKAPRRGRGLCIPPGGAFSLEAHHGRNIKFIPTFPLLHCILLPKNRVQALEKLLRCGALPHLLPWKYSHFRYETSTDTMVSKYMPHQERHFRYATSTNTRVSNTRFHVNIPLNPLKPCRSSQISKHLKEIEAHPVLARCDLW